MKTNNVIQEKTFAFSIRIIKVYKHLCENKKEEDHLLNDIEEILRILGTSQKTVRNS